MRLVEDHVVPHLALENVRISACERVRGDADVKVVLVVPSLAELFSTFGAPVVTEDLEAGEKLFEFHLPVEQDARRDNLGAHPHQQAWR